MIWTSVGPVRVYRSLIVQRMAFVRQLNGKPRTAFMFSGRKWLLLGISPPGGHISCQNRSAGCFAGYVVHLPDHVRVVSGGPCVIRAYISRRFFSERLRALASSVSFLHCNRGSHLLFACRLL